jgi:dTMP kinase
MTESLSRGYGSIVAFDGIDCAGKTTQIQLLAERLEAKGVFVHVDTRIWDGHIGRALSALIEDPEPPPAESLAHLFTAEAILRFHSVVQPKLAAGAIVLSDRSYYSGFAYNVALGATSWEWNEVCNKWAIEPQLGFFIDISPETAWIRRSQRGDASRQGIEAAFDVNPEEGFLRTQASARAVFMRFVNEGRLILVDGGLTVEAVAARVWDVVSRWLDRPADEH